MNAQAITLEALLAALSSIVAQIEQLRGQSPGTFLGQVVASGGWEQILGEIAAEREARAQLPAPFGRYPDGTPKAAPAFDKARALWTAGERADNGHGGREFYSLADAYKDDPEAFERAVDALAGSPFGKYWLSKDANAVLIDRDYQMRWNGYIVVAVSANPDDGLKRITRAE